MDYGFYSEADWELHFQVVALISIKKAYGQEAKEIIREKDMTYEGWDGSTVPGNVDFVLDLNGGPKIAIELKVETYSKEEEKNSKDQKEKGCC